MSTAALLTLLPLACLAAAAAAGWRSFRRSAQDAPLLRLLRLAAPPLAVLALFNFLGRVGFAPYEAAMNNVHLAPTFALLLPGFHLYPAPGQHPFFNPMYPPVDYLYFLPATIFSTPTPAIVVAAFLSAAGCLLALAVLHFRRQPGWSADRLPVVMAMLCLYFFIADSGASVFAVFRVRPDAPAFAFAFAACACLHLRRLDKTWAPHLAAALFVALSIWTKQVMVFLCPALFIFVWAVHGWRPAFRLAVAMAVVGGLVSALLMAAFGPPADLFYDILTVPSRHPMRSGGVRELYGFVQEMYGYYWPPAALFLVVLLHQLLRPRQGPPRSPREFLRENQWLMLAVIALFMLPMSFLQRFKEGGVENAYALCGLMLAASATLGLRQALAEPSSPGSPAMRAAALAVPLLLLPLSLPMTFFLLRDCSDLTHNDHEAAYRFCLAHPGEAHFPEHPLSVLLAEHRMDTTRDGLASLAAAHIPIDVPALRASLSPKLKYIAIPTRFGYKPDIVRDDLTEFSVKTTLPDLKGWDVWMRPTDAVH